MSKILQSKYYQRLKKQSILTPVIGIALTFLISVILILMFYFSYVPDLMQLIVGNVTSERIEYLELGINKIILYLGTCLLLSMMSNFLFIYIMWNIKSLITLINTEIDND